MVLPGYYTASAFVSPDYGINPENDKPDYRTTLYWNPNIIIAPKETNTQVQFYASDRASVYSVRLEGLTADGRPIAISKLFEVQ